MVRNCNIMVGNGQCMVRNGDSLVRNGNIMYGMKWLWYKLTVHPSMMQGVEFRSMEIPNYTKLYQTTQIIPD